MKTLNTILVAIGLILIIGALFVIIYVPFYSAVAIGVGIGGAILTAISGSTGKTK